MMGYPKLVEERITVGVSYTTRNFRRSPDDFNSDAALIIPSTISRKRGGAALRRRTDAGW
jgi:hypothetical protein